MLFQRLLTVVCAGLSEKYRTNSQVHWLNIKFRITAIFVPYHTNQLVQLQINVLFCGQDVPRCAKMCQDVPRCAKMCQDVPRCAKMCQESRECGKSRENCT